MDRELKLSRLLRIFPQGEQVCNLVKMGLVDEGSLRATM